MSQFTSEQIISICEALGLTGRLRGDVTNALKKGRIGMALIQVLRKGCPKIIAPYGLLLVEFVLATFGITIEALIEIVMTNDKRRFIMCTGDLNCDDPHLTPLGTVDGILATDPEKLYLMACQGHAEHHQITNLLLRLLTLSDDLPIHVYHSTIEAVIKLIIIGGLKPMTRHYVHCTTNPQHFPGQRCKLVVTIDLRQMISDGVECWISHNGVYQFKHVDPKYFVSINHFVPPEQPSDLMTDYIGDVYDADD